MNGVGPHRAGPGKAANPTPKPSCYTDDRELVERVGKALHRVYCDGARWMPRWGELSGAQRGHWTDAARSALQPEQAECPSSDDGKHVLARDGDYCSECDAPRPKPVGIEALRELLEDFKLLRAVAKRHGGLSDTEPLNWPSATKAQALALTPTQAGRTEEE